MQAVRIRIETPSGAVRELTVPSNITVGALISEIIGRMNLPTAKNNRPIAYCLEHGRIKQLLDCDHTIESTDVMENDVIIIRTDCAEQQHQ